MWDFTGSYLQQHPQKTSEGAWAMLTCLFEQWGCVCVGGRGAVQGDCVGNWAVAVHVKACRPRLLNDLLTYQGPDYHAASLS